MKEKLVIHTCCAICMCYPKTLLDDYDTIFYFYNPNIHPKEEYYRRRDELLNYAEKNDIKVVAEEGDVSDWYGDIKGFEQEPEKGKRCDVCFRHRLKKTFEYAKNIEARFVTTAMTVSPHKNSSSIANIGTAISNDYKTIEYLPIDFKKKDGFKKTNIIANDFGLYRQSYCGCKYSLKK